MQIKNPELFKISFAAMLGTLAEIYQKYTIMLAFMLSAIIFDIATGLIKARYCGEKISSKKGREGFFRKIIFFITYFFGVFLDLFIPYAVGITGADIRFNCCFGLIIGAYITLNESISICENIYAVNEDIIPKWVTESLFNFKSSLNKNGKDDEHE